MTVPDMPELFDIDPKLLDRMIERLEQNDDAIGAALLDALAPVLDRPEQAAAQLASLIAFLEGCRSLPHFDVLLRIMRVGCKYTVSWRWQGPRGLA